MEAGTTLAQRTQLNARAALVGRHRFGGDPGSGYRIEPPPDISPRRLISRLEGRMIRVAKDGIQAIMQSSRR